MSKLEVDAIEPQSGTTLTIGASGDSVNIASGATITDFTSTGIDDNATSTAIQLNSFQQVILYGGQIQNTNNTSSIIYSGGSNSNAGANLTLFGGAHATTPNVARFRSSATEVMRIDASGNVGIGTTNPTTKLYVNGTFYASGNGALGSGTGGETSPQFRIGGSGYSGYHFLDGTAYYIGQNSNSRSLRIYSGSNENAGAQLSAGGTSFGTYSDERLKKDITDLTNGLNKILALRPVNFKYKSDADDYRNRIGIIAQSIVGQVDEALDQTKITDDDETEYYNVRYQDLIPVLVKGMQEQQTQIEELKARITTLENA